MEFLKGNKRFSFKLGDTNAWDLSFKSESVENGDTLTTIYYFEGGLKITNIATKYGKFGAYEWVNWIENTSDTPTEIISELWDCDCTFALEGGEKRKWQAYFDEEDKFTKVYAPTGSLNVTEEFYSNADKTVRNRMVNHLYIGETFTRSASGGRSSEENAPFFNIHINGKGYIFAIGWTGQWNCEMGREEDGVILKSKIEDTNFRVMPGEKFRTSSVVVMPYEGDVIESQNKWRRLVKEHFSLIGKEGRGEYAPLCANVWGGMKTEYVLERIDAIKKNNLPYEYIWMDAGWFGEKTQPSLDEFESDWNWQVGDWRESKHIHPDGLKKISDAARDAGMKFLLWFEPERVWAHTPTPTEHPEYFITNKDPDEATRVLNLGSDGGWNYCYELISGYVEKLNIGCYRQDFNMSPHSYWRINDNEDRLGITEIKFINGLYKLWDALLSKFPNLIIDNCASGGRRIDIETLRRSVPLWRSDYQCKANCDIETSQLHSLTYNTWMPYSGIGAGRSYDEYRIRSTYSAAMSTNHSFSAKEKFCDTKEKIDFLKKYTEEYLKVRPYFSEDFYPLTEPNANHDTWCAAQFNRPSENDGIVQVFRRENSPHETAVFPLRGINASGSYLFADADGGEFTISGKELSEIGLKITIPDKRKAKIYFYKEI